MGRLGWKEKGGKDIGGKGAEGRNEWKRSGEEARGGRGFFTTRKNAD